MHAMQVLFQLSCTSSSFCFLCTVCPWPPGSPWLIHSHVLFWLCLWFPWLGGEKQYNLPCPSGWPCGLSPSPAAPLPSKPLSSSLLHIFDMWGSFHLQSTASPLADSSTGNTQDRANKVCDWQGLLTKYLKDTVTPDGRHVSELTRHGAL